MSDIKLNELEEGLGIIIVKCKCCGDEYKSHPAANACTYSLTPNYGCITCKGDSGNRKDGE